MDIPYFRYHPDPIRTGVVEVRSEQCVSCGDVRTHMYTGPIYSRTQIEEACVWCVADGTAATKFGATFVDGHELADLPASTVDEITRRTPSYIGWQQEVWATHCNDGCAYLDRVGAAELQELPAGATEAVRLVLRDWAKTDAERAQLFGHLDRDGELCAYLFQCLHCGEFVAAVDAGGSVR